MFVQRDGQPRNTAFNRYNHHRLAYMCGEAPKFQDRISSVVGHLRESGLNFETASSMSEAAHKIAALTAGGAA